jgi:hypothetical protein
VPHPSHFYRCYLPHYVGWGVQIMKFFIMKVSNLPCGIFELNWKSQYIQPDEVLVDNGFQWKKRRQKKYSN